MKDPSFLDFSKMQKFPELAAAIFRTSATMSEERIEKIRAALRHRITRMERLLIRSKSFTVTEYAKKIIAASDRTLTEE